MEAEEEEEEEEYGMQTMMMVMMIVIHTMLLIMMHQYDDMMNVSHCDGIDENMDRPSFVMDAKCISSFLCIGAQEPDVMKSSTNRYDAYS